MSMASSDQLDQQVAVELDVQTFQHEEVAVMKTVEASSTRTMQTPPRSANQGAPLGQASV